MVTVKYKPDSYELKMKGHADFGEFGTDIVCAAISTVFYNFCSKLRCYEPEAFVKPLVMDEAKGKGGVSKVICRPAKGYEKLIDNDVIYMLSGFEMLQGNYPECINLVVTQK